MRRQGTPVSREALYEEIWTDPVTIVAPRYGMSDVGLVKACKRLRIPVPGRGYWAKTRAGHPTRRVPLPALPANAPIQIGPVPLSEQDADQHARNRNAAKQTREHQTPICVPEELVDPLPLVRATASRLNRRDGWDHPAGIRSAPKEVLDLQVTKATLDRALRLTDTLLKSLGPIGFTTQVDEERGQTLLIGGGTTLTLSIIEQITRTAHTPTRAEARARDRYYESFRTGARSEYPNIPQFDWHPTGRLTLTVGSWPSRKWNDTERSRIESRLTNVVTGILELAETKRAKEEDENRRRQAYEEALATHEAQVRARKEENRQLRALFRDASRLHRANRLREYIAVVEVRSRQVGDLTPEKLQWIKWAKAKADWIDPLLQRRDPILDAPPPKAPNFWDF